MFKNKPHTFFDLTTGKERHYTHKGRKPVRHYDLTNVSNEGIEDKIAQCQRDIEYLTRDHEKLTDKVMG